MRFLLFLLGLVHLSYSKPLMTHTPTILSTYNSNTLKQLKNPYTGNVSQGMWQVANTVIDVYDLNLNKIKEIHGVNVECYDSFHCDTRITIKEQKYLSLYASMIEVCGGHILHDQYSVGILRNVHQESTMGKFMKTIDYLGNVVHMSFWIRLKNGNAYLYDELHGHALTFSMMELSIHERAHHDVTEYNSDAGHCDEYQMWYNSMIQDSIRDLDRYNRLTAFIMGTNYEYIGGIVFMLLLLCLFSLCLCDFTRVKGKDVEYIKLREKRTDTV